MYLIWVKNHIKAKNAEVIGAIYKNQTIGLITYEFLNNSIPKIGLSQFKRVFRIWNWITIIKKCIKNLINKKKKLSVVTQNQTLKL